MKQFQKLSADQIKTLSEVKVVITDVDGVLTDGGLYYSNEGLVIKKFNVKDGMGVVLLRENNIECGIISTDKSDIIKTRADRLKMDFAYTGLWDKKTKMLEICEERNIIPQQVAFIGDDVNDLEIISAVGFSSCPADAVQSIKESVDFISDIKGGQGVFREFSDMILAAKNL
ncbi:MAG: HAD hydrolase family protein [Melioribacteraceae bacterium]|nr:HAD hydrolase family protein [Melioribacteraceae bacterium]MCF8355670.1 HAD hydrolase family protein [Melioribacteraceae bacterium]MCF8395128.1 HAD hydrolase family protein [Melioribacteraceae bacterium]MCF8420577.1 HAD hydrolase family protein [Melioribacteraceae bacterium]